MSEEISLIVHTHILILRLLAWNSALQYNILPMINCLQYNTYFNVSYAQLYNSPAIIHFLALSAASTHTHTATPLTTPGDRQFVVGGCEGKSFPSQRVSIDENEVMLRFFVGIRSFHTSPLVLWRDKKQVVSYHKKYVFYYKKHKNKKQAKILFFFRFFRFFIFPPSKTKIFAVSHLHPSLLTSK